MQKTEHIGGLLLCSGKDEAAHNAGGLVWLCLCKDDPAGKCFPPRLPTRRDLWRRANIQTDGIVKILQIGILPRFKSRWVRTSTGWTGRSLRRTQRAISGDRLSPFQRTLFFICLTCRQLRVNEEHSDLSLACEDGQQFDVHKLVLSACSPFFQVPPQGKRQN